MYGFPSLALTKLVVLERLLVTRSVTETARDLGRTQPSITAVLNSLRAHFEDPLLVRHGKGLRLTLFAERLLPDLRSFSSQADYILSRKNGFDPATMTHTFNIRATDYQQAALGQAIINVIAPYAPGLSLKFVWTEGGAQKALKNGEADFAFHINTAIDPALEGMPVFRDEFVMLRDANSPRVRSIDTFCSRAHVLAVPEGGQSGIVDAALEAMGKTRTIAVRTQNIFSAARLVAGTDLLTVVPRTVANEVIGAYGLEKEPLPFRLPKLDFDLVWLASRNTDAALAWFRNALKGQLAYAENLPHSPKPIERSR